MDETPDWVENAIAGWQAGEAGNGPESRAAYEQAHLARPGGEMDPDLSVLRHMAGEIPSSVGRVSAVAPTEDRVIGLHLGETAHEAPDAWGLKDHPIPTVDKMAASIRAFVDAFDPGFHRANVTRELPHVMVMSTGRCGTVSLYHLFGKTRLMPHHAFWFNVGITTRWEMMARLIAGDHSSNAAADLWARTRSAEWLSAVAADRPMIDVNHTDTIFAPAFAAIHPGARFIHLHRDPVKVFDSFFAKAQWDENQLRPLLFGFDPGFAFRRTGHDLPALIAWYVFFTEMFAKAMAKAGFRVMHVSSDQLFAGDLVEADTLLIGAGLPWKGGDAEVVEHFRTPMNEKRHKVACTEDQMSGPRQAFCAALARLRNERCL